MENKANAYAEVYTILNNLEEEEYNKIPFEVIEAIRVNRNEEYQFELYDDLELREHTMLPQTKAILFNLFRDYLATPEEKEKILKMQAEARRMLEEKKEQTYNTDVFANKKKKENPIREELELVEYRESIFKKIMNNINGLFKKNNKQSGI